MIVSVEPMRRQVIFDTSLSAPHSLNILSATAVTPLPEKGRRMIDGSISSGTPKRESNGLKTLQRTSTAPLEKSADMPHITSKSVGSKFIQHSIPSLAPDTKLSKRGFFENSSSI